jgi:hypothetical protein
MNKRTLLKSLPLLGGSCLLPKLSASASCFFPQTPLRPYHQELLNYLRGVYPSLGNRLTVVWDKWDKWDKCPELPVYSVRIDQREVTVMCLTKSNLVGEANKQWYKESQEIFADRVFNWLLENSGYTGEEMQHILRKVSSDQHLFIHPYSHVEDGNRLNWLHTRNHVMSFMNSQGELGFKFLRLHNSDTRPKIAGCDLSIEDGFYNMVKNFKTNSTSMETANKFIDVEAHLYAGFLKYPVSYSTTRIPT